MINQFILAMTKAFKTTYLTFLAIFTLVANAEVHEFELKNGLRVIAKSDNRAPIVAAHIWYRVGSSYESIGLTGISHVLEHMMFKGTPKYPVGELSKVIAKNGGDENAFTSFDYTNYQHTLPADKLAVVFELEADRMTNLNFSDQQFSKELQVILEERRIRTDDNPVSKTFEAFYSFAFQNSGYKHPVIGWKQDLVKLTAEDVRNWYKKWYAPNNATLIVVGDIDPKQVHELAKTYFSDIPAKILPEVKQLAEPNDTIKKIIEVKLKAKQPHLFLGFRVPSITSAEEEWEPYALEVLSGMLSGYNSSRLDQKLIRGESIAAMTSSSYSPFSRLDDLLIISASPNTKKDMEKMKTKILAELALVKSKGITNKELDRIKTQIAAQDIYAQDSINYQANLIGYLVSVGLPYSVLKNWTNKIQQVTREQVRVVANKYLSEESLIVTELKPKT